MKRKLALLIPILAAFTLAPFASAQEINPDIIISWEAQNSYAPTFYEGKILASNNSSIKVRLIVLEENQTQDLQTTEIRWYQNNQLIESGIGLSEISFQLSPITQKNNELTVVLRQYKGEDIRKSINLPLPGPQLSLDSHNLKLTNKDSSVTFFTYPFFFNINSIEELNFIWNINGLSEEYFGSSGTKQTVNTSLLNTSDILNVSIEIEKPDSLFERANYNTKLEI